MFKETGPYHIPLCFLASELALACGLVLLEYFHKSRVHLIQNPLIPIANTQLWWTWAPLAPTKRDGSGPT